MIPFTKENLEPIFKQDTDLFIRTIENKIRTVENENNSVKATNVVFTIQYEPRSTYLYYLLVEFTIANKRFMSATAFKEGPTPFPITSYS